MKWVKKEALDSTGRTSLIAEINILKDLDYPNIVKIFDFFEDS